MNKVFIIAEAGVNHNGDINIAKKLVKEAKRIGCDAVKFQTFKAENIVTRFAERADYQNKNNPGANSQYDMLKALELSHKDHLELIKLCNDINIKFLSSPFGLEDVDFLSSLGMDVVKIPSGEITNLPYLRRVASLKKKIILSTGMSDMNEIKEALNILIEGGVKKQDISILHCNTEYPTPYDDVNLKAMLSIRDAFGINVGYSDHTPGIEVAISAVALGATIIEKHFTLDKSMVGPDHKASLEPEEFKIMVDAIRNIEKALGDGVKRPSSSELKNKDIVRKSIVALLDIKKGDVFSDKNVTVKRPGTGISPMLWDKVIGQISKRDFKKDELIEI
ncbi:MAG TPA: N-acetylneuraminate synthase [bacterium]|nr:N-acetylneuraminate synthase [bacterium]